MFFMETKNYGPTVGVSKPRLAAFLLMCLVGAGVTFACLSQLRLPLPPARTVRYWGFVSTGPLLRVELMNAVVPASAWRRISARRGGDEAGIARAVSASGYVTWKRNVITAADGKPVASRSLTLTSHRNPSGAVTVAVMAERGSPAACAFSPETCRTDRFAASITLRNGTTRILRTAQDAANAPMRVSFITAETLDIPHRGGAPIRALNAPAGYR
jgi:hypothetical protein